jgi:membrane dipeptidase
MFGGLTLSEKLFRQQFGRVAPGFFAGYDIDTKYVEGFDDVSMFPRLTHGLLARGFSEENIEAVLGGNFLRVFEATW